MSSALSAPPPRRGSTLRKPEIQELFARLRELNPHPTTELEYTTPFELLIAVLLSAQATDVGVHGHGGFAERGVEHHVGGLAAHAR